MSIFADELKQSLLEAIDIAKGRMDKSEYHVLPRQNCQRPSTLKQYGKS